MASRYFSTAARKVSASLALRLSANGSPPPRTIRLLSSAASRAIASVITGGLPSLNSRRRPATVMRCTQNRVPLGSTRR